MTAPALQVSAVWPIREVILLSLVAFVLLCSPRWAADLLELPRPLVRVVGALLTALAAVVVWRNFGPAATYRYLLSAGAIGAVLFWLDLRDRDPRPPAD